MQTHSISRSLSRSASLVYPRNNFASRKKCAPKIVGRKLIQIGEPLAKKGRVLEQREGKREAQHFSQGRDSILGEAEVPFPLAFSLSSILHSISRSLLRRTLSLRKEPSQKQHQRREESCKNERTQRTQNIKRAVFRAHTFGGKETLDAFDFQISAKQPISLRKRECLRREPVAECSAVKSFSSLRWLVVFYDC